MLRPCHIYSIFKPQVSSPDAVPTPIWTSVYGQKAWLSRKFSITLPFPIVQVVVVSSTMWFSWVSFFSQLCYFVHVLYLYMWGYNFNLIFVGLRSRRPPPTSTSLLQLQLPPVPTTTREVTWQRCCLGWGQFDRYYEGPPPTYRGREESRSRWVSTFSVTNILW